jgi:transposase InsO family protein
VDFLRRAVAWFAERGVVIRAVMSNNGSAYIAHAYRKALAELGLNHLQIKPLPPKDQRQGRALHPNPAQRMGLQPDLRQLN